MESPIAELNVHPRTRYRDIPVAFKTTPEKRQQLARLSAKTGGSMTDIIEQALDALEAKLDRSAVLEPAPVTHRRPSVDREQALDVLTWELIGIFDTSVNERQWLAAREAIARWAK